MTPYIIRKLTAMWIQQNCGVAYSENSILARSYIDIHNFLVEHYAIALSILWHTLLRNQLFMSINQKPQSYICKILKFK